MEGCHQCFQRRHQRFQRRHWRRRRRRPFLIGLYSMDDHVEKLSQFRDSILYKETSDESAHHSDPAIRSIWDQVLALCPHHKPPHWESKLCVVILSLIINSSITMNVLALK